MAHLVNASSTRVGWTQSWCDVWFSRRYSYADYLHSCLRIRFFLAYLYFSKKQDRRGLIFSHFNLIKNFRYFQIDIFYYDSRIQTNFDDFVGAFFKVHENMLHKYSRSIYFSNISEKTPVYKTVPFWIVYFMFVHLCGFELKNKILKKILKQLALAIHYKKINMVGIVSSQVLQEQEKFRGHFSRLLVLCYGYLDFMHNTKKYVEADLTEILGFYYEILCYRVLTNYWNWVSDVLRFIFEELLTSFKNFNITYYLISNDEVRAFFIARFLAKKFSQNLRVKSVLHPLKREFQFLMLGGRASILEKYLVEREQDVELKDRESFLRNFWYFIFRYFILNYDVINHTYYKQNNIWCSLDLVFVLKWLKDQFRGSSNLLQILGYFFENRSLFICLFFYKIFRFIDHIQFQSFGDSRKFMKNFVNVNMFPDLLRPIFLDFFISKLFLFDSDKVSFKNLSNFKLLIII